MSYYEPLHSYYDLTRYQIEQGLISLQERILRRKQLDLLYQRELIQRRNAEVQRQILEQEIITNNALEEIDLRDRLRIQYEMGKNLSDYRYGELALRDRQSDIEIIRQQQLRDLSEQNEILRQELRRSRNHQYQQNISKNYNQRPFQKPSNINKQSKYQYKNDNQYESAHSPNIQSSKNKADWTGNYQKFVYADEDQLTIGMKIRKNQQSTIDRIRQQDTENKYNRNNDLNSSVKKYVNPESYQLKDNLIGNYERKYADQAFGRQRLKQDFAEQQWRIRQNERNPPRYDSDNQQNQYNTDRKYQNRNQQESSTNHGANLNKSLTRSPIKKLKISRKQATSSKKVKESEDPRKIVQNLFTNPEISRRCWACKKGCSTSLQPIVSGIVNKHAIKQREQREQMSKSRLNSTLHASNRQTGSFYHNLDRSKRSINN